MHKIIKYNKKNYIYIIIYIIMTIIIKLMYKKPIKILLISSIYKSNGIIGIYKIYELFVITKITIEIILYSSYNAYILTRINKSKWYVSTLITILLTILIIKLINYIIIYIGYNINALFIKDFLFTIIVSLVAQFASIINKEKAIFPLLTITFFIDYGKINELLLIIIIITLLIINILYSTTKLKKGFR